MTIPKEVYPIPIDKATELVDWLDSLTQVTVTDDRRRPNDHNLDRLKGLI